MAKTEETEREAYLRNMNDFFSEDKKIGEEIQFISGQDIITITRTQEFEDAIELLENTNKSVFITGKAGTGKSTLLKYFRSKSRKQSAVLSFTGLAAINVGGETIHSFFRFPMGFMDKRTINANTKISHILHGINTLVLDEVSMIRADLMDCINVSLQKNKENALPFGGVQMIFIGDLHQLPPIVEKELQPTYARFYKTPFFFSADVFKEHKIVKIDLQKIHRQTEPVFVEILNNIREKNYVSASVKMLNRNVVDKSFVSQLMTSNFVVLCTTNDKAKTINDYFMSKLTTPIQRYSANVRGDFDPASYPTEEVLALREGCKVIFVKNDTGFKTFVNGDIGIVKRLTDQSILVELKGKMVDVERAKWEKYKYEIKYIDITNEDGLPAKKGIVTKTAVGSFEQ